LRVKEARRETWAAYLPSKGGTPASQGDPSACFACVPPREAGAPPKQADARPSLAGAPPCFAGTPPSLARAPASFVDPPPRQADAPPMFPGEGPSFAGAAPEFGRRVAKPRRPASESGRHLGHHTLDDVRRHERAARPEEVLDLSGQLVDVRVSRHRPREGGAEAQARLEVGRALARGARKDEVRDHRERPGRIHDI